MYSYTELAAGAYNLLVTADEGLGFFRANVDVPGTDSVTVNARVALVGSIKGVALLEGRPASSSAIDVSIPGTNFRTKTVDDGTFELSGVPSGVYNLNADAVAYKRATITGVVVEPGSATTLPVAITLQSENRAPTASFTVNLDGFVLDVDASASSDPDGVLVTYVWDFGDGNVGAGVSAQHIYDATGPMTVALTVTDDGGRTTTARRDVVIDEYAACVRPEQQIHISDDGLEEAILYDLLMEAGPILCEDMKRLSLLVGGGNTASLEGLQHATNLGSAWLGGNRISDLTPLSNLTRISELRLGGNPISDLTPIANMTGMVVLALDNTQLGDLTPLAGMEGLHELRLTSNLITDLQPLSGLTNIGTLRMGFNQIGDLTPLANLTNLRDLSLDSNQVSDLTPLANLDHISALALANNRVSDLTPLANLSGLRRLYIEDNQISDVTPLSNLENLASLWLEGNNITDIGALISLYNLTDVSLKNNYIVDLGPLVSNMGLGNGDYVNLEQNCLDVSEGAQALADIRALELRGVTVLYGSQYTCP